MQAILDRAVGDIYVSPFDLNVEYGEIEPGPRPVIRFGTSIPDAVGEVAGMMVLNLLGQPLLDDIAGMSGPGVDRLWLLNRDGYWLLGPERDLEWGFMYPSRAEATFGNAYPQAWATIRGRPDAGQVATPAGLFTYASVRPGVSRGTAAGALPAAGLPAWTLVGFLPASTLDGLRHAQALEFIPAAVVLALLLAGLSVGIARGSVQRRETEHRIRAGEERFRAFVESAPDAIVITDTGGRIVLVNAQTERLFGHPRHRLIGEPVEILIPQEVRDGHAGYRQAFARQPRSREMGAGQELNGLRADGTSFPVAISLSPVQTEDALLIVADIRDMTDRHEVEMRRRASEVRFRALLESAPDAVVIADTDGRIVLVNAQTERLFGHPRDRMIGQDVEMLVPEPLRMRHAGHRRDYLGAPRVREMGAGRDLHGLRADGTTFPVSISLSPVRTDEGMLVVADIRDVSDRLQAERQIQDLNRRLIRDNAELEAVNKELEAFSYSVSHDLRAPLRAIDGFSQALAEDFGEKLDEDGQLYLTRVRQGAQRMGLLIDDLLKLSRVTRQELVIEPVDLGAIAREILGRLQAEAPERKAEIAIQEGLLAQGDQRLLQIVLENLLGNAWKFTAGREVARIEFGERDAGGVSAFCVADNGAGFDMVYADQLFRAFQRLHTPSEFPGSGIGLATVQRIIHKHGGRVWAEATIDSGARFYFTLQ